MIKCEQPWIAIIIKTKIFSILQNETDILAFYCHFIRSHPLFLITYCIELTAMFDNDKRALSFICPVIWHSNMALAIIIVKMFGVLRLNNALREKWCTKGKFR